MSADMIPVNMRRNRSNSLICQLFNLRRNIADAKPRVDQQRTVISFKEIAVRFFPMTVFADYMCAGINCINPIAPAFERAFELNPQQLLIHYQKE